MDHMTLSPPECIGAPWVPMTLKKAPWWLTQHGSRKFKRLPNGELKANSRLCARGFLDPQKEQLPTRSATATRLSQRLVVSTAAAHLFKLASLDVSGAFLKGFTFEKVHQALAKRGVVSPPRKVVIIPPPNTWRQLSHFDSNFHVPEEALGNYGLLALKPAYGLNDAPLAWQMALQETLQESGGQQSLLDECLWHFKTSDGQLRGLVTTHVDDLAMASGEAFLLEQQKILNNKYGRITAQSTPFTHCGCRYSALPDGGFKIDQQDFLNALECQDISDVKDISRRLAPEELTKFRSALGGLLWLTATRLDLTAEVSILQSKVTKATVGDLLTANALIKKAKQKQHHGLGLVYRHFPTSTLPWRLLAIHDASAAAKGRNYAQEGVIILLAPDHLLLDRRVHTISGTEVNEELFGGTAHIVCLRLKGQEDLVLHESRLDSCSNLRTRDFNTGESENGRDPHERPKANTSTTCGSTRTWCKLPPCGRLHRLPRLLFFHRTRARGSTSLHIEKPG